MKLAIKLGNTVVVENVDETVSSKLYPLFLFEKAKSTSRKRLNVNILMDQAVV